jgi:hypothetical protein
MSSNAECQIARIETDRDLTLRAAVGLWAEATTAVTAQRRKEVLHDKELAVKSFFDFIGKNPADATPKDVQAWRSYLEGQGLSPATVYARISRLSSFFNWLMSDPQLAGAISGNPVLLARPESTAGVSGRVNKSPYGREDSGTRCRH